MSLITNETPDLKTHTHSIQTNNIQDLLQQIKTRLEQSTYLALPLDQTLEILDQLSQFELGRFLLVNRGLSGYWTSYIILPSRRKEALHPLEEKLITKSPIAIATRERFHIFQEEIQKRLQHEMKIASIPCGLMDDLLSLNYNSLEDVEIFGIDLDLESLKLAHENVKNYDISNKIHFSQKDAWHLGIQNQFDLITSNGLNVYEPDDDKVTALYKNFYNALRKNGTLITSFLTPPPILNPNSSWKPFNPEDLVFHRAIFSDIIQAKWQAFRTEDQTRNQLESAGFKDISIIYDQQCIFPTIIAQKN